MTPLDDPASVAEQYAREDNLLARRAFYEETEGTQPWDILRDALRTLAPRRSRENGAELLERHFSSVERTDADVKVTVRDREKLVAYRDSMSVPVGPVPEDVPIPFLVHARTSIFVATK